MIARPNVVSVLPPASDDLLEVMRISMLLPDGTVHYASLDSLGALTIQRAIVERLFQRHAEFRRWARGEP